MILSKRPSRHAPLTHLPKLALALLACAVMIGGAEPATCEKTEIDGATACALRLPAGEMTAALDPLDPTLIDGWY